MQVSNLNYNPSPNTLKVLTPSTPKHNNQGNTLAYVKPLTLNKKINYHLCQVMGIEPSRSKNKTRILHQS
jgi:hypothetical protein